MPPNPTHLSFKRFTHTPVCSDFILMWIDIINVCLEHSRIGNIACTAQFIHTHTHTYTTWRKPSQAWGEPTNDPESSCYESVMLHCPLKIVLGNSSGKLRAGTKSAQQVKHCKRCREAPPWSALSSHHHHKYLSARADSSSLIHFHACTYLGWIPVQNN